MEGYKTHEQNERCLEPFSYLLKTPGKQVRGKLIAAFNEWLLLPEDKLAVVVEIITSLHNASLLLDDIEDGSKMRRGVPAAHVIFGTASVINSGNYVYFIALEKVHQLNNVAAMNIFVSELLRLHRGQGKDILWRDNVECPTENEYKEMVLDKTGGLFRLAVGLMQAICDGTATGQPGVPSPFQNSEKQTHKDYNFTPLLDAMALYFQIRDDFINLCSTDYMKLKMYCEDLTEGKFSFPVIHSIRTSPQNDNRLVNILKQRTSDRDVKDYALKCMRETKTFLYTRNVLKDLRDEVYDLGGHRKLSQIIATLDEQLDKLLLQSQTSRTVKQKDEIHAL